MTALRDTMVPCRVQLEPDARWIDAYRRKRPYVVSKHSARVRAELLGVESTTVPPGDWYSVVCAEQSVRFGGKDVIGGSGWREVPECRVRDR